MQKHFPLFNEKIGPNKALKVIVSLSHIEVKLGQPDADIALDYTLHFSIHHANHGARELLYDEVRFTTAANLGTSNDDVHIRVQKHEMNLDSKFGGRSLPIRNNMKMTRNEYREFLAHLGAAAATMKNWMNSDIFHVGVKFPYRPDEFLTEVRFQEKSVHILFELEEDMTSFLEKKMW